MTTPNALRISIEQVMAHPDLLIPPITSLSPCVSPYLPISPHISLYLPNQVMANPAYCGVFRKFIVKLLEV